MILPPRYAVYATTPTAANDPTRTPARIHPGITSAGLFSDLHHEYAAKIPTTRMTYIAIVPASSWDLIAPGWTNHGSCIASSASTPVKCTGYTNAPAAVSAPIAVSHSPLRPI